ncbi:MAG: hypothetical protein ACXVZM_01380, partial [Terriglobales bacterium]
MRRISWCVAIMSLLALTTATAAVLGEQKPEPAASNMDILSDTMGVDFGPYLSRVLHDVRLNW